MQEKVCAEEEYGLYVEVIQILDLIKSLTST